MEEDRLDDDDLLTVGEAAKILGVHPDTLRTWTAARHIDCGRTPGGQRRYLRGDVDDLAERIRRPE